MKKYQGFILISIIFWYRLLFYSFKSYSQKISNGKKVLLDHLNVNKLIKLPVCIGSNPLYCKNGINIPAIVDVPKKYKKVNDSK